uniref:Uncharacterized protein n=1 Tax=Anopheles dirus TaxID=7168 RepID=A0A182NDA0_9DIPT
MSQICQGHEKTGFISGIQDDIPQFNHRIFAEYFAAYWLYENKNCIKKMGFFRSKSFWAPIFIRMRDFFDRLVVKDSNDCDFHMAVLNQSEEEQVLSNDLRSIITEAHNYGKWLLMTEDTKHNVDQFLNKVVHYLINELNLDIYDRNDELDSLTVLEFCVIHNMSELLKRFACQTNEVSKYLTSDSCSILKLAFQHKAYDILIYLINELDISIPQETDAAYLIMVLKFAIELNETSLFETIFHILGLKINIIHPCDTNIDESIKNKYNVNYSIQDKDLFPKECCVSSLKNILLPLPEYNDNDILHEGYVREALLAKAVHEGNLHIISYIVHNTNLTITNRLIVMLMRLMPKGMHVCHHKSIPAFMYLLDRSTDLEEPDKIGRNLLHMTAQNGCFFMLHCLVLKGFDPTLTNKQNDWNVFHYTIFNDDEDLFESKNEKGSVKLLSERERNEANACMEELSNGLQETTLLKRIKNDPPKFTHRIFAEYFAAFWLYDNKNCMKNKSFFRSISYWTPSLRRLRDFFDQVVIRDSTYSNIHMAIHNQSEKRVSEILQRDSTLAYARDAVGRSPLDLAVRSKSLEVVQQVLAKVPSQLIDRADQMLKFSALDYAFLCGSIGSIKLLIERGAKVNVDTLIDQILSPNLKVLLQRANNYGNWLQLYDRKLNADQFFTRVVQYLKEEMKIDNNYRHSDIDSLTVLEFCGKYNMVGIFDKFKSQVYASDQILFTEKNQLLRIAFENDADDVVNYIVKTCTISPTQLTNNHLKSIFNTCVTKEMYLWLMICLLLIVQAMNTIFQK